MTTSNTVFSLLLPYWLKIFFVVILNFISVIFSIITFLLLDPFIHILFYQNDENMSSLSDFILTFISSFINISNTSTSLVAIVILFVLLYLLKNVSLYFSQYIMATIRSGVIFTLRNKLYDSLLILPLSYHINRKKGDVVSRAVNDTQEIELSVLKSFQQFLYDPITIIFYLAVLFIIHFKLTLFVLFFLPLSGLIISTISRKLRRKSVVSKTKLGNLLSIVEESLSGLKILNGFNAQKVFYHKFDESNNAFTTIQKGIYRRVDLASPISEFLGITIVMIVLVVGGMIVLSDNSYLSPELFITYIILFTQIINPAKTVSTAFSNYKRGLSAIDRVNDVLNADEVIIEDLNPVSIKSFNSSIEISHLNFSYPDNEVFKDFNISIPKGKMVALVGASGSGKSTLVDLLLRFYDVSSGQILIDEVPINKFVIDDLRSLYALVSQDVVLFNDSIYQNIIFGMQNVSFAQVEEAARLANILDYIQSLPDGFNTNIGDRGLLLSGGQRQRISIARAILRKAPILILDEATSAMDVESEQLLQDALNNLMLNRTSLVIAHRLATIRNADIIYVINHGQIVESGSHQELYDKKGYYYNLIQIQQI